MPQTVRPAVLRKFQVFWYANPHNRERVLRLKAGDTRRLPPAKPTRLGVYTVEARTLDGARKLAKQYVEKRGNRVTHINFQNETKLIVYTEQA